MESSQVLQSSAVHSTGRSVFLCYIAIKNENIKNNTTLETVYSIENGTCDISWNRSFSTIVQSYSIPFYILLPSVLVFVLHIVIVFVISSLKQSWSITTV